MKGEARRAVRQKSQEIDHVAAHIRYPYTTTHATLSTPPCFHLRTAYTPPTHRHTPIYDPPGHRPARTTKPPHTQLQTATHTHTHHINGKTTPRFRIEWPEPRTPPRTTMDAYPDAPTTRRTGRRRSPPPSNSPQLAKAAPSVCYHKFPVPSTRRSKTGVEWGVLVSRRQILAGLRFQNRGGACTSHYPYNDHCTGGGTAARRRGGSPSSRAALRVCFSSPAR